MHFHHQHLVRGNGEFVQDEDGAPVLFPCDSCYIVVSTQRKYHLFLDGGTFHHLLVHNLECHEIHFIRYVGPVPDLCMKVQQPVMGVKTAQQVLDAERLAPDMLDVPFVVLVDGLRDEIYQFRRLAAEFLQVNVKGVVGTVHFASVMDEILHLDVQQQRFFRILYIECIETSAFGYHGHVGLLTEILYGSLYTNDIFRTVRLACNEVQRSEVHITHRRREDDMRGLVVSHFQTVRRYHPVESEFSGQPVIEVPVFLFLGIHFLDRCDSFVYYRCAVGFSLGKGAHGAPCKGKHYK